jgi:transposase
MKRTAYSVEIKNKAIKMKLEGYSTREIMDELNVRHKTQIKNCWKW